MTPAVQQAINLYLDDLIEFKNCMEFFALFAGLKPVVRITALSSDLSIIENSMQPFVDHIERSPLALAKVYANDLGDKFYKLVSGPASKFDLLVAYFGVVDKVEEAIHAEITGCDDQTTAMTLGYPSCCASNYTTIKQGQHWIHSYLKNVRGFSEASWRVNKIASLFPPYLTLLPDYFPCSVECKLTLHLAHVYHGILMEQGLGEIEKLLNAHLTGLTIIAGGEILFSKDYTRAENGRFVIKPSFQRLRFDSSQQGLPQQIQSVNVSSGHLKFIIGEEYPAQLDITLGDAEGVILFS
jgi:hypothetical protein